MSDLTRQERFSMSRQFAKELVAGSIITDAAAQFLALMIEEVHNTKIAPLQAELKRRADLLPTISAAMQLPEVRALVDAATALLVQVDGLIPIKHPQQKLERNKLRHAITALAAIKETKT